MITTPLLLVRFQPDFDAWLAAAQHLLQQGTPASSIEWLEETDPNRVTPLPDRPPFRVNDQFLQLARRAACHRAPERWTVLYRILWRLVHGHSRLLSELLDPDVTRLHTLARDVERDVRHVLKTTHFTAIDTARGRVEIGWAIPQHHTIPLAAPLIARQQQDTLWSLLTPDQCVHWTGSQLTFSEGEKLIGAGSPRALEQLWRTHHAARFNLPAEEQIVVESRPESLRETSNAAVRVNAEWNDLPLFASRRVR